MRLQESTLSAHDLWTAFREGAFREQPHPFVGWLILVEDAAGSRKPVRNVSRHFPTFSEFDGASWTGSTSCAASLSASSRTRRWRCWCRREGRWTTVVTGK